MFVLSLVPFVLFLVLLLWKKTSLLLASIAALLLVWGLAVVFWQILPIFVLASFVKGFLVALDIFIIIFGAVFFIEILQEIKIIDNISYYLESFSKDYRVQVILLAWFFENFLEGTAGFGTPCAVVAPILISLGLSPITAVVIALLGNSTAGVFGAAGTPIRVGFADLKTGSVPIYAALISNIGFLVPVFMLWILLSGQKERKNQFLEGLPFAVFSGLAFVLPSTLTVFFGQEFPSILGSVFGIFLAFLVTRLGLFLPKNTRSLRLTGEQKEKFSIFKDLFPYALLTALLVFGKLWLPSVHLKMFSLKHTFNFFNPGFVFILTGLPVAIWWGRRGLVPKVLQIAARRTMEVFLVIFSMSAMVQLMINSGNNLSGIPSFLESIAEYLKTPLLPFYAPLIGAFGGFLTGSVTVSNIMFGNFIYTAGVALNFNVDKVLALELVGGAVGNMVALADILATEAVVGLKNKEREVVKGVIIPCVIICILIGIMGILLV